MNLAPNRRLANRFPQLERILGDVTVMLGSNQKLHASVGPRVSVATRRPVLGQHDSLVIGFGDAPVRDQAAGVQLNLDLVLGLAHLHAAPDPVHRDRVSVVGQRHIPFDIDQPLLQPVYFRNQYGQRLQVQPLDGERLARNRADMLLVSRVDFVAPLLRPPTQVLPTAERAPAFPIAWATN